MECQDREKKKRQGLDSIPRAASSSSMTLVKSMDFWASITLYKMVIISIYLVR